MENCITGDLISIDGVPVRAKLECCNENYCTDRKYDSVCPDWNKMRYADVNYDGIVNAGDWAMVIHTLSTKPDDD